MHRTLENWRTSRTVLIYKKGDEPTRATGGLLLLATRSQQTRGSSRSMVSVLQERLEKACSSGHEIWVAFLDFTDAYGFITSQALLHALQTVSAGSHFVDIIPDLCINCTRIVAAEGITTPISILAGIRQGCPLSGLLFELVVDAAIRDIQGGDRHHILPYADNLTPMATSPEALQGPNNRIEALASELSALHLRGACFCSHF